MNIKKQFIPRKYRNKNLTDTGGGFVSQAFVRELSSGGGSADIYLLSSIFSNLFEYDEENDAIKAKKALYSVADISAFGLGSEGGTGGGSGVSVLSALNDVAISAIANGNVLIYNSALSKWENKPQSAIIPDLSPYAQKTYVEAAVSALVATAPSTLDTLNELATALGNDPNFATTITTLIGSKEGTIAAGTNAQYWRGDKTWQSLNTSVVTEGTNQYFTTARVLATALAGYSVGSNAALATSDTLLAAFGKIQAQINSKQASGSYQPLDADLTAIAALAGTSGFLKKTASDTWALDTMLGFLPLGGGTMYGDLHISTGGLSNLYLGDENLSIYQDDLTGDAGIESGGFSLNNTGYKGYLTVDIATTRERSTCPLYELGNGWDFRAVGSELHIFYNGVKKGAFTETGFTSTGEITAYV